MAAHYPFVVGEIVAEMRFAPMVHGGGRSESGVVGIVFREQAVVERREGVGIGGHRHVVAVGGGVVSVASEPQEVEYSHLTVVARGGVVVGIYRAAEGVDGRPLRRIGGIGRDRMVVAACNER